MAQPPFTKKRRLFVCCDGTWKNASGTFAPLTNVARLARCVDRLGGREPRDPENVGGGRENEFSANENDVRQIVYYSSGVGAQAVLSAESGFAGLTGEGVTANILNAYCFICNNYNFYLHDNRSCQTDEIILVGFSRGAFTVRCLAAFISDIGLLRRKALPFLLTLFKAWLNRDETLIKNTKKALRGLLFKGEVTVLAEWDTVDAMGLPFLPWPHKLSRVNDVVPSKVKHAFLAVALNEQRPSFVPMLWREKGSGSRDVKQCAFLGSHSDVGGGNQDAGLSTVSLLWMMSQIRRVCGARFDDGALFDMFTPLQYSLFGNPVEGPRMFWPMPTPKLYVKNSLSTEGRIHESLKGWWLVPYYLTLGLWHGRRDALLGLHAQKEPSSQSYLGLHVHFTVRAIPGKKPGRSPDNETTRSAHSSPEQVYRSRIQCGLFSNYNLIREGPNTPENGNGYKWKNTANEVLPEAPVDDIEHKYLKKWKKRAEQWGYENPEPTQDTNRQNADERNDVNWMNVFRDINVNYLPGCKREKSLIHLISSEVESWQENP